MAKTGEDGGRLENGKDRQRLAKTGKYFTVAIGQLVSPPSPLSEPGSPPLLPYASPLPSPRHRHPPATPIESGANSLASRPLSCHG